MRPALALLAVLAGCSTAPVPVEPDGAAGDAGTLSTDAGVLLADTGMPAGDAAPPADGGTSAVDGGSTESLEVHRERLLATLGEPCPTWGAFDASRRAVFLTLTHRLFTSRTPDGASVLSHITRVYLVLGGGAEGTSCGGDENNRLFLQMDAYLWDLMVRTWNRETPIADGAGSTWVRTRDIAGPHDPFDASAETDTGLRCVLLWESDGSRPPTAQAHFFQPGAEVPISRGAGISLPADPHMLEIDHDFDCVHDSNPTCEDFTDRYVSGHGDFGCDWVPAACTASGTGCYRGVAL